MKTKDAAIEDAAVWAAEEYERRTRLIATGSKFIDIEGCERPVNLHYYMHPLTRVNWHEVCKKFGLEVVHPEHHAKYLPLFRQEMKKRNLHLITKGNMKSDQWVKKFPTKGEAT